MKWLVLGANSGIARAVLEAALLPGDEAWLLCRRRKSIDDLLGAAEARGLGLRWLPGDALEASHLDGLLAEMGRADWRPDRLLLAWGLLRREPTATRNELDRVEEVNGRASLAWLNGVLRHAAASRECLVDAPLRALVLGSVAGDRVRPSLAAYGRSKRRLEQGVDALRDELSAAPITLTLAKPGPVRTPMLSRAGWARRIGAEPEPVARRLLAALEAGRPVVYAPAYWRLAMALLKRLPGGLD